MPPPAIRSGAGPGANGRVRRLRPLRTRLGSVLALAASLSATAAVSGPGAAADATSVHDPVGHDPVLHDPVQVAATDPMDRRQFLHGVNLLPVGKRLLLIFSANSHPPRPAIPSASRTGWEHDIFHSWIDPANPGLDLQLLVEGDEAQEPASAAMNTQGRILVTSEDGQDGINQFAGLWDAALTPIRPYPEIMIRRGGHSGHAAAIGEQFLVVYGEGWIDGDGVSDLGTGDDVWARPVGADGVTGPEIEIAVGDATRDWWPVVAASDDDALVVWQRHRPGTGTSGGTLEGALVDAAGSVGPRLRIADNIVYYVYETRYIESLDRYLVLGDRPDGGFAVLIDRAGRIAARHDRLPATIREARPAIVDTAAGVAAVYPTPPTGVAVLRLGPQSIELAGTIAAARPANRPWDSVGIDGVATAPDRVLFAAGSIDGLDLVTIDLTALDPPGTTSPVR